MGLKHQNLIKYPIKFIFIGPKWVSIASSSWIGQAVELGKIA